VDNKGRADRLLLSYEIGDIEKDYPPLLGKPRFQRALEKSASRPPQAGFRAFSSC